MLGKADSVTERGAAWPRLLTCWEHLSARLQRGCYGQQRQQGCSAPWHGARGDSERRVCVQGGAGGKSEEVQVPGGLPSL